MEQSASTASHSDCGLGLPPGESFAVWQLAKILTVHRSHIVNFLDSGEIKCGFDLRGAQSSPSTIRIPRAAVVEFLERRRIIVVEQPLACGSKKSLKKELTPRASGELTDKLAALS